MNQRYRIIIILSVLMILFFGPIVLAWYCEQHKINWFTETTNKGHLISPSLDIAAFSFKTTDQKPFDKDRLKGKWVIAHLQSGACESNCLKTVYDLHQLHIALGVNAPKVARVMIFFKEDPALFQSLSKKYPEIQMLFTDKNDFAGHISHLATFKKQLDEGSVYLIDPAGNMMMAYGLDEQPEDILDDLKHLLRAASLQ